MKIVILLISLLPLTTWAQIPKGTSRIIIENNLNSSQNIKSVKDYLFNNLIQVEKADSLFVQTVSLPIKGTSVGKIRFNIYAFNNKIIIKSECRAGYEIAMYGVTSKDEWIETVNKGMRGSLTKSAFLELDSFPIILMVQKGTNKAN